MINHRSSTDMIHEESTCTHCPLCMVVYAIRSTELARSTVLIRFLITEPEVATLEVELNNYIEVVESHI